ncbi:electron transfer flavoprotein alpha subunit apoprotein [Azomonas agilis]|uniref:Electron transfer flavoprotein subunit alpha n=1 Tax=Azomonas agilis TaxID=116849 RepID=A0A562IYA7_9GAMM|nr:FAD-binding protein [Azomonas agilis]TWH75882.1 electron transfer flavoprotein alpha subunit apoprotein [Azomonas agilis]
MTILVIAEHNNRELASATLNTLTAAQKIGSDIHVLVAGHECQGVAAAVAKISGVSQVLLSESPSYAQTLAEHLASLVARLGPDYSHILAPATTTGKNYLPRVAALLDVEQLSEVVEILAADTFKRPIYAGNALATVQTCAPIKVLSIRPTAFAPAAYGDHSAPIQNLAPEATPALSRVVAETQSSSDRPDLGSARIVISGGRGLQNSDSFQLLYQLADKLGAAVGASRAAVDAGYVSNDLQVGQTGKIVAPDLYIAVGISGAIQHVAGMKDSKIIVAINKDEEAPIFQVADYGLVGDLFELLPELERAL